MSDTFKNVEYQRDFELWAFGYSPVSYGMSAMHAWNSRHGDSYYALPNECVDDSLKKMVEVYDKHLIAENGMPMKGLEYTEHFQRWTFGDYPIEYGSSDECKKQLKLLLAKYMEHLHGQKDASSHKADEDSGEGCEVGQEGCGCKILARCGKKERKARKDRSIRSGPNDREVQENAKKGEEVMDLLTTYAKYVETDNKAERAAFEAAMTDRLRGDGYKMSDLLYELFVCQKRVAILQGEFEVIRDMVRSLNEHSASEDYDEDEDE